MSEAVSRRRKQTREALIDGARRVFAARGVAASSIEEICEASGFTRGAFYSNFASRDEIVLAIMEREIDTAQRSVTELVENRGEDLQHTAAKSRQEQEELIRAIVTQFHALHDNTSAWILAGREIELYTLRNPELRYRYDELIAAHFENMSTVIGVAIERAGGRLTLPLTQFVDILAAVSLAVDPEPVVQVILGLIDFS